MIYYLCNGNKLAGTQADAKALDRNFTQIDIPVTKLELMAHVQGLMDQINAADPRSEGERMDDEITAVFSEAEDYVAEFVPLSDSARINNLIDSCKGPMPKPAKILPPVYATVSITIDDEWDKLPLPRQLHFAALAMEAARERISA